MIVPRLTAPPALDRAPLGAASSASTGTGDAIGTGSANTDRIIAQNGAGIAYAAGLARAYTGGGYTDWYLPSKDELERLYGNRDEIGGFDSPLYWSSSDDGRSAAWYQDFQDRDHSGFSPKPDTHRVRAVRDF